MDRWDGYSEGQDRAEREARMCAERALRIDVRRIGRSGDRSVGQHADPRLRLLHHPIDPGAMPAQELQILHGMRRDLFPQPQNTCHQFLESPMPKPILNNRLGFRKKIFRLHGLGAARPGEGG